MWEVFIVLRPHTTLTILSHLNHNDNICRQRLCLSRAVSEMSRQCGNGLKVNVQNYPGCWNVKEGLYIAHCRICLTFAELFGVKEEEFVPLKVAVGWAEGVTKERCSLPCINSLWSFSRFAAAQHREDTPRVGIGYRWGGTSTMSRQHSRCELTSLINWSMKG